MKCEYSHWKNVKNTFFSLIICVTFDGTDAKDDMFGSEKIGKRRNLKKTLIRV